MRTKQKQWQQQQQQQQQKSSRSRATITKNRSAQAGAAFSLFSFIFSLFHKNHNASFPLGRFSIAVLAVAAIAVLSVGGIGIEGEGEGLFSQSAYAEDVPKKFGDPGTNLIKAINARAEYDVDLHWDVYNGNKPLDSIVKYQIKRYDQKVDTIGGTSRTAGIVVCEVNVKDNEIISFSNELGSDETTTFTGSATNGPFSCTDKYDDPYPGYPDDLPPQICDADTKCSDRHVRYYLLGIFDSTDVANEAAGQNPSYSVQETNNNSTMATYAGLLMWGTASEGKTGKIFGPDRIRMFFHEPIHLTDTVPGSFDVTLGGVTATIERLVIINEHDGDYNNNTIDIIVSNPTLKPGDSARVIATTTGIKDVDGDILSPDTKQPADTSSGMFQQFASWFTNYPGETLHEILNNAISTVFVFYSDGGFDTTIESDCGTSKADRISAFTIDHRTAKVIDVECGKNIENLALTVEGLPNGDTPELTIDNSIGFLKGACYDSTDGFCYPAVGGVVTIEDIIPPRIESVEVVLNSVTQIKVTFDEAIYAPSVTTAAFTINDLEPASAVLDSSSSNVVILTAQKEFDKFSNPKVIMIKDRDNDIGIRAANAPSDAGLATSTTVIAYNLSSEIQISELTVDVTGNSNKHAVTGQQYGREGNTITITLKTAESTAEIPKKDITVGEKVLTSIGSSKVVSTNNADGGRDYTITVDIDSTFTTDDIPSLPFTIRVYHSTDNRYTDFDQDDLTSGSTPYIDVTAPGYKEGFISGGNTVHLSFTEPIYDLDTSDLGTLTIDGASSPDRTITGPPGNVQGASDAVFIFSGDPVERDDTGTIVLSAIPHLDAHDRAGNPLNFSPSPAIVESANQAQAFTFEITDESTIPVLYTDTFIENINADNNLDSIEFSIEGLKPSTLSGAGSDPLLEFPPHNVTVSTHFVEITFPSKVNATDHAIDDNIFEVKLNQTKAGFAAVNANKINGTIIKLIDVGNPNNKDITFDEPVRIEILDATGIVAGDGEVFYIDTNGKTHIIDAVCKDADSIDAVIDQLKLTDEEECAADSGGNLVIWTYHFTKFGASIPAAGNNDDRGGGGNDFDFLNAPTFGLAHDSRSTRMIDSGISLNGFTMDVDSFHTEFARQILQTGQDNTLSAKVMAPYGLKTIEFFYGVPRIGAASSAEGSIEIHLNPYDTNAFPQITDIIMRDNEESSHLLSANKTTVTIQRTDCIAGDARQGCYQIDIGFVFANSPVGEVFAMQAVDAMGWSTTEYFNDGFEVQGNQLMPATRSIPADLKKGGKGSIEIVQIDRKNDLWMAFDGDGALYTKNEFGFWKKLTPDTHPTKCQDSQYDTEPWSAMTRMHCQYDKYMDYAIKKAQKVFDSSAIQKELPDSFAHEFPLIDQRTMLMYELGYLTVDDAIDRLKYHSEGDDQEEIKNKVRQLLLALDEDTEKR